MPTTLAAAREGGSLLRLLSCSRTAWSRQSGNRGSGRITLKEQTNTDRAVTLDPADPCGCGECPTCLPKARTKKVDYVPTGKVKWYDKEKGFGFLAAEDGQEVFLPKTSLPAGVTELKAGTRVEFGVADGRRGAQALGLRVLEKTPSIAKAKRMNAR